MVLNLYFLFKFFRYNDTGFAVNGVEYEGSLLCVGNLLLSWKPKKFSEITADRFVCSFLHLFFLDEMLFCTLFLPSYAFQPFFQ